MATREPDASLTEFGVSNAPRVRKRKTVTLGAREVGYFAIDTEHDERVYVSERDPDDHRYHGEDPWYDLPFDGDGYGLSTDLFARLVGNDIGRIYIVEPEADVYHFSFMQFVHGAPINMEDEANGRGYEKDPQKVVAIEDAVDVWRDHASDFRAPNAAFR